MQKWWILFVFGLALLEASCGGASGAVTAASSSSSPVIPPNPVVLSARLEFIPESRSDSYALYISPSDIAVSQGEVALAIWSNTLKLRAVDLDLPREPVAADLERRARSRRLENSWAPNEHSDGEHDREEAASNHVLS